MPPSPRVFTIAVYKRIVHGGFVICVSVTAAVLCCVHLHLTCQENRIMQTSTVIVLTCLLAVVVAAQYEHHPAIDQVYESVYDTPTHDSSPRQKRGLLLLKKKLLLGALGLKAVKVGAVGVAGALALKSKAGHSHKHHDHIVKLHSDHQHHVGYPQSHVEVHDWSG